MSLAAGSRFGAYEIGPPLGAGGMGEVYRARDTRLARDVAIKVLAEPFAQDAERLARFRREAQVLASLNHPHIAAIYGIEEVEGQTFLVLELVEGETLAERIGRGALPVDDAVRIATQIGDALAAAHDKGIVHRDLKPANVALGDHDQVKVLDFGLAKADGGATGTSLRADDELNSPTITSPALVTSAGMILGTAAYMSPEPAKGRSAERRSDVWAFGCVLFEMLTGKRAFTGDDVSETLAAVLRSDPDWQVLPADTPVSIRAVLQQCLVKDARARLGAIDTALFLLRQPCTPATSATIPSRASGWRLAAAALASAVVFGALGGWGAWRYREPPPGTVARLTILLPEGQTFSGLGSQAVSIAPDGTRIAYVADRQLYVRALADPVPSPIAGTRSAATNVFNPVFAPDGQWIAFVHEPGDGSRALKKVGVTGGAMITLAQVERPTGMTWGRDGILLGQQQHGIARVAPEGGTPERLIEVKPGEVAHGPQMLPSRQHVLFTLAQGSSGFERWESAQTVVQSLATGERKVLGNGSDARYLPTGHLVYALQGVVHAVAFDVERLAIQGAPAPVLEGVLRTPLGQTGAVQMTTSENGSLVYVPGPATLSSATYDLAWVDRQGRVERLGLPPRSYLTPRISPDGSRIAFSVVDGDNSQIWVLDLDGSSAPRQLTFNGRNRDPVWTAAGDRLAFQSDRDGTPGIYWQPADGTAPAERLTSAETGTTHVPFAWSPRDTHLLFGIATGNVGRTLWTWSAADRRTERFGTVEASVSPNAVFSPDGKWVAYVAGTTASRAVFVQPFPRTGAEFRVSPPESSPMSPLWSPDQKELFYGASPGNYVVVHPQTHAGFSVDNPTPVPDGGRVTPQGSLGARTWDISRDGKRFLILVRPDGVSSDSSAQVNVVLNWFEELKQRVRVP